MIGFTQDEIDSIYKIIGTILLLVSHLFTKFLKIGANGEVAYRYPHERKWLLKCYMNVGNSSVIKNKIEIKRLKAEGQEVSCT